MVKLKLHEKNIVHRKRKRKVERLSAEIHRDYRQASEKFDYFLTGVTIAICGYLVQIYDASGLKNFDVVSCLGLFSICLFLLSLIFGFKRTEKLIHGKRKNYNYLKANERISDISNCLASGKKFSLIKSLRIKIRFSVNWQRLMNASKTSQRR